MNDDDFQDDAPEPGELIYRAMLAAPDLHAALASLPAAEKQELYGWLLRNYHENAVTGKVLGELLVATALPLLMKTRNDGGGE